MSRVTRRLRAPTPTEMRLLRRATWRLGLQVGLTVALIVVLLSGLAVLIVLQGQQRDATALLRQTTSQADDVDDPPAGIWLAIQGPSGLATTVGTPSALPDRDALANVARTGVSRTDEMQVQGVTYQIYTQLRGAQTFQAARDMKADHEELERLLTAMLASGGVGLVLAVAAGVWLGRRAVAPLAVALGMQRRFVADASHELRTPLTLLSTRAQMLRRHMKQGTDPERLSAEVDGVVADAGHLTHILEDLLLAADVRSDGPTETIDLVDVAAQVAAASTAAAAGRSITVEVRAASPSLFVRGTRGGLLRAITALVDNAVAHASNTVTVTTKRTGTTAAVEIADDGPGIDPAVLPRLFQRFASTRRSGPHRHYGIGLALVGEIADRHGGHVTAADRPGGGALLTLTFPLVSSDGADAGPRSARSR